MIALTGGLWLALQPYSLSLGQGMGHFKSPQQAQHLTGGREGIRLWCGVGSTASKTHWTSELLEGGGFQAQSPVLLILAQLSDCVTES